MPVRSIGFDSEVGWLEVEGGTKMKQTSGASSWTESACSFKGRRDLITYGILIAEYEAQSVHLIFIERVVIQHSDVHLPFSEVVCLDQVDAGRKLLLGLGQFLA